MIHLIKTAFSALAKLLGLSSGTPRTSTAVGGGQLLDPQFWGVANVQDVQSELRQGAYIEAKDEHGATPLSLAAAYSGDPEVIKFLLDQGADVRSKNAVGWSVLHSASVNAEAGIIELVLNRGADVDIEARDVLGATPLHSAATNNSEPTIIHLLLDKGADINVVNDFNNTPLMAPLLSNTNLDVIEALFKRQPLMARLSDVSIAPLHFAAAYSTPFFVNGLLARGANIEQRDNDGWAPLHYAGAFNSDIAVIQALLDAGADINARDVDGLTPLYAAARKCSEPGIIALLARRGASVVDEAGMGITGSVTPLHCAASENSSPYIVAQLLDEGADIAARDSNGRTPLHWVCTHNHEIAIVEMLLDRGANIDARDNVGMTPIHLAAENNQNPRIIEVLLSRGADITATDGFGQTPLDLAEESNRESSVVQLLRRYYHE